MNHLQEKYLVEKKASIMQTVIFLLELTIINPTLFTNDNNGTGHQQYSTKTCSLALPAYLSYIFSVE